MHVARHPDLDAFARDRRFNDISRHRPLVVTCELEHGAPVTRFDAVHFDGILANAVVRSATDNRMLPESRLPYDIPLPLTPLWRDARGLSLWAATCFEPADIAADDMIYLHKRAQSGVYTAGRGGKFTIDVQRGRWMERRAGVPVVICWRWQATVLGDGEAIADILQSVSHVGKHRRAGFGEVRRWTVEDRAPLAIGQLLTVGGRLARPVPLTARSLLGNRLPEERATAAVGWTPPYWHPGTWDDGWRSGTLITEGV